MSALPDNVPELQKLISAAEKKIHVIGYARAWKADCYCDRYTCESCRSLQFYGQHLTAAEREAVEKQNAQGKGTA